MNGGPAHEMSGADAAMLEHMKYIVKIEARPFSYLDFETFKVGDRWYHVAHGTCRNKFCELVRKGVIDFVYNSKVAFYTLKGCHFGTSKKMTGNHMGVSSVIPVTGVIPYTSVSEAENFFGYLKTLDTNANSIHDIHKRFTVLDIYKIISSSPKYSKLINPVSKDIPLEVENIDGMHIHVTVHRTDTVTVIVGCSREPITIDERGITRLSCALTRIEERLSRKLDECGYERIPVPNNGRWQVTMWHFGKDKFANEYPAKGYALTWGHGREVLRTYIKNLNHNKINRNERQEYPNKTLDDALNDKRSNESSNSDSIDSGFPEGS
jgi:hypothetical protein